MDQKMTKKIDPQIEESWKNQLMEEFQKPYFLQIKKLLQEEKKKGSIIYPSGTQIFRAFDLTPFHQVKVVILGQDPYHGAGQAHGLCFSVQDGVKAPPSLVNIFKELKADCKVSIPESGNLERWARQGVFLLNSILTVSANHPASHRHLGWQNFTDQVIRVISDKKDAVVFLLWGKYAQEKDVLIDTSKHLVLKAPHPSPFSANSGFFGCRHFSGANEFLMQNGLDPVIW